MKNRLLGTYNCDMLGADAMESDLCDELKPDLPDHTLHLIRAAMLDDDRENLSARLPVGVRVDFTNVGTSAEQVNIYIVALVGSALGR